MKSYGKFSGITVNAGDEMLFVTPSGGGYGDPLDRDPELVLEDCRLELISTDVAREVYGVVVDAERRAVDPEATEASPGRPEEGLTCRSIERSTRCPSARRAGSSCQSTAFRAERLGRPVQFCGEQCVRIFDTYKLPKYGDRALSAIPEIA